MGGDVQQKTSKAVQRYVAGRDVSSSLFDDAQASAFNEMLPYWITFSRHYTPPPVDRPIPRTYASPRVPRIGVAFPISYNNNNNEA